MVYDQARSPRLGQRLPVDTASPVGSVVGWVTDTAPVGWLICDGSAISRVDYAALYQVLSTTYGVGDGSTTFNLPDLRGRVPIGGGTATGAAGATAHALASKGGEETHALTGSEAVAHRHGMTAAGAAVFNGARVYTRTNAVGIGWTSNLDFGATSGASSNTSTGIGNGGTVQILGTTDLASNTAAGAGHNNMQPFLTLNYIIKA